MLDLRFSQPSLLQVLYLVDPIDELAIQNLKSYKEKNFVDISKEDLDLGLFIITSSFIFSFFFFFFLLIEYNTKDLIDFF